jgi:hypothetical protein
MAGTWIINQWNGASPGTKTAKTSGTVRHATDDVSYSTGSEANPIPIPASAQNYSFWSSFRLESTVAPVTAFNNIVVYTDGTNSSPTGVTWRGQAANVGADAGYRQATGTVGTTGTLLNVTNHTGLTGAITDIFGWTSGSPKALAGSIGAATGDFGDFLVYQIKVPSTVSGVSEITGETIFWALDET